MGNNKPPKKTLAEALAAVNEPKPTTKLVIKTKRSKHTDRLEERIKTNAIITDQLIDITKSLVRKNNTEPEVDQLIDIVKALLDNNAKLSEQVGEAIRDIPING